MFKASAKYVRKPYRNLCSHCLNLRETSSN